jgi:CDP-4-dehydro-6-deoxyglucose reductase
MTHRVHMLPSRHEFLVEGVESLLEAALRAGLAPEYGCNNGTCGLCKARLVSGEVRQIRHHDHPLTEAEKAQGHFLMCSYTALTDLAVEAPEAWGAQGIPVQQLSARVKKTERPGPEVCILHLQTPRTQRLRFLAGQYASIAAPNTSPADFSIASCPCDGRNLQFHIPRLPGLPFSDYVFGGVRAQDTLSLEGPKGSFTLREEDTRPIVFLACNTGFGAVKSLVEQAMAVELPGPLHLYWLASPGVGHYLRNLCRSWVDALDNFHYTALTVSAPGDPSPQPSPGGDSVPRALRRMVRDHADIASYEVYIAGPSTLIAPAERFLLHHGVPRDRILVERIPRQP